MMSSAREWATADDNPVSRKLQAKRHSVKFREGKAYQLFGFFSKSVPQTAAWMVPSFSSFSGSVPRTFSYDPWPQALRVLPKIAAIRRNRFCTRTGVGCSVLRKSASACALSWSILGPIIGSMIGFPDCVSSTRKVPSS